MHIGGDEAPKAQWERSAVAQAVMEREGLRGPRQRGRPPSHRVGRDRGGRAQPRKPTATGSASGDDCRACSSASTCSASTTAGRTGDQRPPPGWVRMMMAPSTCCPDVMPGREAEARAPSM
ncbi:hypothetical protein [Gaopeijia maritima]|uniref:hypothetical protein n=1 Tax=Gaopeijia maritima TaxID=3119007 RepID=UPI00386A132F